MVAVASCENDTVDGTAVAGPQHGVDDAGPLSIGTPAEHLPLPDRVRGGGELA